MRKGEIACNKQFLLFSQFRQPYIVLIFHFKFTLKCRLQVVSIWTCLKFCRPVTGYESWLCIILSKTSPSYASIQSILFINPFPNDQFRPFQTERVCRQQFQILGK